ncbi:hypothetical protein DRF62_01930 [Chryseobacterium piscium]|uniref:Uncharacterized protein n=1 Tax=Chryseobacterium piscium TaxID=333702 RepID=A0A3D9BTW7_9FLAO|nr:hypothetical protein [Chryseobacterium piscium]REC56938.1 hypothetical protein DRF62_01930 [Chryseobacterium piscium]
MSYEEKLQRVRTDVTLQELNQAIKGDAQAMAGLFTIQAELGGSGIATGNVSSYFRKWRSLKDNNFVGSLANRLGRYVKAIDEPYSFSGGMGDVDIVTKSFNIEVKSGNKMKITQSLKNKEFSKTEGKDYILYMPKATNKQIYEASKKGIKVIKTEKALIKAIK